MDTDFHNAAQDISEDVSDDVSDDVSIDRQTIQDLRDEGDNLLGDLVEMFIGQVPAQLATLEAALAQGDTGATRLSAHTLKGTGGNFGASRMEALAGRLEENARSGSLDGAPATFVQLRAECGRVRQALEAVR